MKGFRIISLLSTLFAAATCSRPPAMPEASVTAHMADSKLTVTVNVPDRHHAYLDGGREGNLIPVTFDWKSWTDGGLTEPTLQTKPEGVPDEDSGAQVLHGQGLFVFELRPGTKAMPFRVRVQICDEVKGICYRPAWHDVRAEE